MTDQTRIELEAAISQLPGGAATGAATGDGLSGLSGLPRLAPHVGGDEILFVRSATA